MLRDAAGRGLDLPKGEMARQHWLRQDVAPPDLETMKDFIRFYIATCRPQSADVSTVALEIDVVVSREQHFANQPRCSSAGFVLRF